MHTASTLSLPGLKVLVTGGNGFIGSVVVKTLVKAGCSVRCLLRSEKSDVSRLEGVSYERAAGDVRDAEGVRKAVQGCEAVVHMACLSSWDLIHSPEMKQVVLDGTRNILAAARAAGVRKLVYMSTGATINGSDSPKVCDESSPFELDRSGLIYAITKHEAERMCLAANDEGLPVVILNPGEVYGPNDIALITAGNLIDAVKSSPVMVCSGGVPVTYVDDVAEGTVRALERGRPGERYILAGENLTVRDLAQLTLDILGLKKRIMVLPNMMIRGVARGAKALRVPLPFNPNMIPYATRYWFVDSSKAKRELGVTFRTAREALSPTLDWLKETGRLPS
jgi:dihydroflavonol-4-reductase